MSTKGRVSFKTQPTMHSLNTQPRPPNKSSTMSKYQPLRLVTLFLIILTLTHIPSLAYKPANRPKPAVKTKQTPSYNLEMRWGLHNFDHRICRIFNACLTKHAIAVHPWMKPHLHHLHACGITNITYLNPLQQPVFQQNDVFGAYPARYHIPHFLTDVLPMVYATTLLKERSNDIQAVCETPRRGPCKPCKRGKCPAVNPLLLVEERAKALSHDSWVKQLVRLLPGKPGLIAPAEGCYRSVVAYNNNFVRKGRRWYSKGEFFKRAGVSRESVLGGCKPHVVVLNRVGWEKRGGILLGRDIVNVDQVVDAVRQRAPRHGLNVSIEVAYFENRTLEEQIGIMQRADVLLGVHGAGLANLLFAKMDVGLLEVLPFGYYAGPFDRLASTLHLNFSRIIAKPDNESFTECLKKLAEKDGNDEFKQDMETWKNALDRWNENGDERVLQAHLLSSSKKFAMKVCTRGQRLWIDPKITADRLLDMAVGICTSQPSEV